MVRKSLETTEQLKVVTKLPPTLPPVGTKTSPAVEGGARPQVTHPPSTALELNPTDPLLACPRDETLIAAKTQSGNPEGRFHELPAARRTQDVPTPFSLPHPGTAGAPSLEPTSSPAQVLKRDGGGEP